jgi:Skp family chaperone for outer membrane proteins
MAKFMIMRKLALFIAFAFLGSFTVNAQRMAYVDMEKIMERFDAGISRLEAKIDDLRKEKRS